MMMSFQGSLENLLGDRADVVQFQKVEGGIIVKENEFLFVACIQPHVILHIFHNYAFFVIWYFC